MAIYRKVHYLCLAAFCTMLLGLHTYSSAWFRIRLADYYKGKHQHDKAIQFYNKILAKDIIKKRLRNDTLAKVNFDLGYLYTKLGLKNLAIESYAKGSKNFSGIALDNYYINSGLENDKLLAIGLLEAGRWDMAIEEFRKLKKLYSQFQDAEKYIDTAALLKRRNLTLDDKNSLFVIGDAYIQNKLYDEVKAYFTKRILDYGVGTLEALDYLQRAYSGNKEIKEKIWGKDIYVSLEDFESTCPRLSRSGVVELEMDGHYITKESAYRGMYSEFLDMSYYSNRGPDSWVKIIKLPLDNADLKLGLRLFTKNINPSVNIVLGIEATYPKQGTTGISLASVKQDIDGNWQEHRMEALFEKAEGMAKAARNNWDTEGMLINKIIVCIFVEDSDADSYKFYIDEIELYLL